MKKEIKMGPINLLKIHMDHAKKKECPYFSIDYIGLAAIIDDRDNAHISDFWLPINYSKSIKEAISLGNYDKIGGDIHYYGNVDNYFKYGPLSFNSVESLGVKTMLCRIIYIHNGITHDYATRKINEKGYRAATCLELLSLGYLYPELQRYMSISALGSSWINNSFDKGGLGIFFPIISAQDYYRRIRTFNVSEYIFETKHFGSFNLCVKI